MTHKKVAKRILRYVKGTLNYGMFYTVVNDFSLLGFSDNDLGGDVDDRKSTSGFVFFMGIAAFGVSKSNQFLLSQHVKLNML